MSEPENFLERWSRLKRQARLADSSSAETGLTDRQPPLQAEVPSGDAQPPNPPPFDPATLPPIESIRADSDIRPFLQPGVPEELTGAALRSAWVADPSIRDFVEMADNQWDFNDESAMPGFGSLGAAQHARELVNKALQSVGNLTPSLEAGSRDVNVTKPTDVGMEGPKVIDQVWTVGAAGADGPGPGDTDSPRTPASNTPSSAPASRKPHGTALPK